MIHRTAILALAILAGAFSLASADSSRDRDAGWREFMKRCGGVKKSTRVDPSLREAVERLEKRDKDALRARLARIRQLTAQWVRAEKQGRAIMAMRALVGGMYPSTRQDVRPAMDFIMQLNGFAPRKGGVMGRKTKMMI